MGFGYRAMTETDYDAAYALWASTPGMGLSDADSHEAICSYLKRNAGLSQVCVDGEGRLAGTALCGHDGRRGFLYHVAVPADRQGSGIGRELAARCLAGLAAQGISKCHLMVLEDNEAGSGFWNGTGWEQREGLLLFSRNTAI